MSESRNGSSADISDAVKELAAWLIALEDSSMYEPVPQSLIEHGRTYVFAGLTEKHAGDCTNECHTCVVCSTSDALDKAKQILAALLPHLAGVAQAVGVSEAERHAIAHARYQSQHASPANPDCHFDYELVLDLLRVIDRAPQPSLVSQIEAEARRYASMYPQSSDGRNTFVIFADWVARLASQPSPAAPVEVPPEVMERRRKGLPDYERPPLGQPPSWLQEQEKIVAPDNGSSAPSKGGMKLYISEPEPRESGAILISDDDRNDVAEFFHNEHATVGQSYETALALAQKLVTGDDAQAVGMREALESALAFINTALVTDENPTMSKGAIIRIIEDTLASQPSPAATVETSEREVQTYKERISLQVEMIDRRDAEIAALKRPSARKFVVCGDCGLDDHCGDRCQNSPDRLSAGNGDAKSASDLVLIWRGWANALRLMDAKRSEPQPEAQAQADAYEQCAIELREALSAAEPQSSGVWQPIETAAQDGTRILATGGGLGETVEVVTYNERVGCWSAETCTLDDTDHESQGYNRPTLWQPMPSSQVTRPNRAPETSR
ncbi:hypothetical protein [Bradyrhizobium sp. 174]|uniref:hypothetical protein n=1 Tax=Bradyrhizobium sp. 174 TaxID=2782645 RepID=UPI001FFB8B60|nr:hypothetical protein [Bradyrhizobium sp. 174]MCK1577737.1 hypothetical protein [Bradyrhizobium sp. 174]